MNSYTNLGVDSCTCILQGCDLIVNLVNCTSRSGVGHGLMDGTTKGGIVLIVLLLVALPGCIGTLDEVFDSTGTDRNFMTAKLDGAFRGTDLEAVEMSWFLLKNDGFFLGSSLAMNCVQAIRCSVTQSIGPSHSIVTMICDSEISHLNKFHSAQYLSQHGLTLKATRLELLGHQMS
uniref:Uncharacterized protein n=1 Tax=Quercus lobata TaxID=97700 RepID=A0A7N2M9A7_QUELO